MNKLLKLLIVTILGGVLSQQASASNSRFTASDYLEKLSIYPSEVSNINVKNCDALSFMQLPLCDIPSEVYKVALKDGSIEISDLQLLLTDSVSGLDISQGKQIYLKSYYYKINANSDTSISFDNIEDYTNNLFGAFLIVDTNLDAFIDMDIDFQHRNTLFSFSVFKYTHKTNIDVDVSGNVELDLKSFIVLNPKIFLDEEKLEYLVTLQPKFLSTIIASKVHVVDLDVTVDRGYNILEGIFRLVLGIVTAIAQTTPDFVALPLASFPILDEVAHDIFFIDMLWEFINDEQEAKKVEIIKT